MGRLLLHLLLRTGVIHTVVSPSALEHLGFAVMFPIVEQPFAKHVSECQIRDDLCQGHCWEMGSLTFPGSSRVGLDICLSEGGMDEVPLEFLQILGSTPTPIG